MAGAGYEMGIIVTSGVREVGKVKNDSKDFQPGHLGEWRNHLLKGSCLGGTELNFDMDMSI